MEEGEEIQLFSSVNEYEINQICAILKENKIVFIKKEHGSGAYMNIYMGQSIWEKIIYVEKKDYEQALELITPFLSNDKETKEEQEKKEPISNKHILAKRCLGLLFLGMPVIILIAVIIMSIINH